ncbi:MAG: undecaprenyldiphospho-muramoylpentapeptide beta-N-acetylglucosaminyltransferase [Rhodospirillales bacterium]|nr:undecaprenyldiphospho-muramoylpentapeptide beta-N-acetylglucosaminyltransferase [Alphaproteobacteria bacterium]MCB1840190.1 undecaprenyldiphospho-muramoylpentapeptide beta-N-acetylglucosaminyltransferase [Alphaproteobacteria bacterium]MCB9976392.1 undecaprenyldiphospho-muramoylpentapeptide beta-N-acetylglucosaminyltransferase [Rhodospirillales bacterium]
MNDTEDNQPLILISSGGTGGHMTPAAALAHDLSDRGNRLELVTDERGKKFAGMFPKDIPVHVIRAGTIGRGPAGKLKGAGNLAVGLLQAWNLVSRLEPDLVIGFGGYPSFPGVIAAQYQKIPTIIHEQNAIIGKANCYLARGAERIALSFPEMRGLEKAERMRSVITGNPVRAEIAALHKQPYPKPEPEGPVNLLVMGGSLGAAVFSKVMPQTLAQLPVEYKKRLSVVQQCRAEDLEMARKAYEEAGIKADLAAFYDDMADRLAAAHLVICRSGASTVAEVTSAGRPAIFVPYPHHKDQQQKRNADHVADGGGAWLMTEEGFTPEALLARITTFLQNPEVLRGAAEKCRAFGKPDAAHKLGNLVKSVVAGSGF